MSQGCRSTNRRHLQQGESVKTPLSERIRPNSEAAPWVIDEVKKLEEQNKIMLDAIKEAVSYPDDYYWRIINELLEKTLQDVEGENQ